MGQKDKRSEKKKTEKMRKERRTEKQTRITNESGSNKEQIKRNKI